MEESNKGKIGVIVTNNGNRLLGYINVLDNTNTIEIHEPIVIVRGEISNTNPNGEIVLSNIDSLIGLNIVDQIDSLIITNPSFYTLFKKDVKEYEEFHKNSYNSIIESFKKRFDEIKKSNNGTAIDKGVDNKQIITPKKKGCGCKEKSKKKLAELYEKLKAKKDNQ